MLIIQSDLVYSVGKTHSKCIQCLTIRMYTNNMDHVNLHEHNHVRVCDYSNSKLGII